MTLNIYIVVLTFIMLIVVIYMAENVTTAVLIISLMANFLIICTHLSSIEMPEWVDPGKSGGGDSEPVEQPIEVTRHANDEYHMYGPDYDRYHQNHTAYTTAYAEPKPVIGMSSSELVGGVDAANALMAQRRARDKKCIDGYVSKTADYYRHHFNDELERSENKDWRSQYEW